MGYYDTEIRENERKINFLHAQIHEAFKCRDINKHKFQEWKAACEKFHASYDRLAFPGGLEGAYERILRGESASIEAALCFVEIRPYFFRSGYMYKDLLRKLSKVPLNDNDLKRYQAIKEAYLEYRARRKNA